MILINSKGDAEISLTKPPDGDADVWFNQIPFEIPNLDKISKEQFERYVLVISIMEENLKEYSNLKRKLESILYEIKSLNLRKGSEVSLKKEKTIKKEKVIHNILRNRKFLFKDADLHFSILVSLYGNRLFLMPRHLLSIWLLSFKV